MHILTSETYQKDYPGFYKSYIRYLTDEEGYLTLNTLHNDINITVQTHFIEDFNQSAKSYMTDAEGTYIYDLVAIGGFANTGADLFLYATLSADYEAEPTGAERKSCRYPSAGSHRERRKVYECCPAAYKL